MVHILPSNGYCTVVVHETLVGQRGDRLGILCLVRQRALWTSNQAQPLGRTGFPKEDIHHRRLHRALLVHVARVSYLTERQQVNIYTNRLLEPLKRTSSCWMQRTWRWPCCLPGHTNDAWQSSRKAIRRWLPSLASQHH